MDLSTGQNINTRATGSCANAGAIGTGRYTSAGKRWWRREDLTWPIYRAHLIEQAEQGVDYFTIPAGVRRPTSTSPQQRRTGIVSRGGSILAKWCITTTKKLPYTHFEEICDIMKPTSELFARDGLRRQHAADANDEQGNSPNQNPGRS